MKKHISTFALMVLATPALAASGPFFSLGNTDFVVLISFLLFLGVLVYFKVPSMIGKLLDERSESIRSELNEAKALREEAQTLLASYERKQREVQDQADRIVAHAREEAKLAGEQARKDLSESIVRRMAAAEDQIASAEASAVKQVRDRAAQISIGAAADVIAKQMTSAGSNDLIDQAIAKVSEKLH